jgi:glycosyltransferase involved in cell wall biosynthesis
LQKIAQKYAVKLKVIGADIAIEGIDVELVDWDEATEVNELLSSDIGIMPLENTMWEKGKCGFKLVQYMACGLPVIASAAPANEEIIENGVNGFIIHNEDEWYAAFEKLIVSAAIREQFGIAGRRKIELNYSYQVWGNRYSNFIKKDFN